MAKNSIYRSFTVLFPGAFFSRFKKIKKSVKQASTTIQKLFVWPGVSKKQLEGRLLGFFLIYFILFLVVLGAYLLELQTEYKRVVVERKKELANLAYWEEIVKKHPNFPDAYYNAAVHSARLNDRQQAYFYLEKALELDPTFQKAQEFKKKLEEKVK